MRVLVVDAFEATSPDAGAVEQVVEILAGAGHDVDWLCLTDGRFASFMSAEEHRAYETATPLIAAETSESAERVTGCEALVFCYPTTLFGAPPVLKSWLERVMVRDVAFRFDEQQRVRPALTNVRRLAVVTTSVHGRFATWRRRDLGYRTFMRTLRLNCHPRCRRTFVRLPAGQSDPGATRARLARSFRW